MRIPILKVSSEMSVTALLLMPQKALQWFRLANFVRTARREGFDPRQNRRLGKQLAEQRGLAMKSGQIFAGATGESALKPLVSSVEPLALQRLKKVLRRHYKRPLGEIFLDIEESQAAASLGQVHRATLRDGQPVALKIRYPGIVDAVKAELGLISLLPSAGPARRWNFDMPGYKQGLKKQLLRELDYRIEAETQFRMKSNLDVKGLHIPDVIPELSGEALLVQSWERGESFDRACTWPKAERLEIGRILLTTLFRGLFVFGEVHGDPHMGNYLFQRKPESFAQVTLLDFGCTVCMSREQRLDLLTLLIACRRGEPFDIEQCFARLGFDLEKLGWISEELPELCRVLFKPFLSARSFDCREWKLNAGMNELLQERKWWFRTAAPAELFPWMRIFHGLIEQLNALDISLPWWPLLEHSVGKELLAEAESAIPAPSPYQKKGRKQVYSTNTARTLRIQIDRVDQSSITVRFPVNGGLDLKAFMPEEIHSKLLSAGYADQLNDFEKNLNAGKVQTEPLFDQEIEEKRIRAWVE